MKRNNKIKEAFCSFSASKLLKKNGFKVPCDARYYWDYQWKTSDAGAMKCDNSDDTSVTRPTHAMAIEWIRVNFKIMIWADYDNRGGGYCGNYMTLGKADTKWLFGYKNPQKAIDDTICEVLKNIA
jgi:hypothetical protein